MNADTVFDAYVECALWSSNDESDEAGGEPFDRNYSITDIDADALAAMRKDLEAFLAQMPDEDFYLAEGAPFSDGIAGQLGHDFWLTRNRHGAGFWESEWSPFCQPMTDLAHSFGESNLYLGDDGRIYVA